MRIIHVTRDFPPRSVGGLSTAVGGMVDASVKAKLQCAVLSFDAWRPRSRTATPLKPIAIDETEAVAVMRLTSPGQLTGVFEFVRTFAPDVLHVHDGMLWEFAEGTGARVGSPTVFTVHIYHQELNRLRSVSEPTLGLLGQDKAIARATRVIAPSRAVATLLEQSVPDIGDRLRVVGLGVADSPAARSATSGRPTESSKCVLYVGRFADIKGTDALFAAIPRILERVEDAEVCIAGGVPENKSAEKRWINRFREEASEKVLDRVTFCGWVDETELLRLYQRASVLVVPSRFETFGQSVLEGMLHGVAIAATQCGGIDDLVEHGRTGLISSPSDVDQLAGNVVSLLERPDYALRLGQAGAEHVRETHLWTHVLPSLRSVYQEAVATGA